MLTNRWGRRRAAALLAVAALVALPVMASVRVKDLATLEGARGNALYGYGLVVGLKGTGDRRQTLFTAQSLRNLLERQGLSVPGQGLRVANVAGVMVTTTLTAFAAPGSQLDINVASIGDASSLLGGVLLLTPLVGADGQVYATAQGPLVVGGASAESASGASRAQTNHPTVGRIVLGATVERDAPSVLAPGQRLSWALKRPDFATAKRLEAAIDQALGSPAARAIDSRRVEVDAAGRDPVAVAATVEELRIDTGAAARVVVNERTGTVVAGRDVRLKPVSIVHGGLTIDIRTDFDVAQPGPFSDGVTTVVPVEEVEIGERPARALDIEEGATVEDLTRGLLALGATATDVISILQTLHEAGALEADVEAF